MPSLFSACYENFSNPQKNRSFTFLPTSSIFFLIINIYPLDSVLIFSEISPLEEILEKYHWQLNNFDEFLFPENLYLNPQLLKLKLSLIER
jgi:hypothetical protein